MSEISLDDVSEQIAGKINSEFSEFEGFDVRADAGSLGAVYVALRQAQTEYETGERFADEVAPILERELEGTGLDFAVSMGAGDEDMLLQIEIRQPQQ